MSTTIKFDGIYTWVGTHLSGVMPGSPSNTELVWFQSQDGAKQGEVRFIRGRMFYCRSTYEFFALWEKDACLWMPIANNNVEDMNKFKGLL